MYQFAGDGGGILIDFTPDTAPAFMKAAEAQGIVDKVKWGSSTPIANTFMAGPVLAEFDGHLWIDNEFSNVDPNVGPDSALMFQILKKYAPKIAPQAFAQMGFIAGSSRRTRCSASRGRSPRSRTTRRSWPRRTRRPTCSASRSTSASSRTTSRTTSNIIVDYKNGQRRREVEVHRHRGRSTSRSAQTRTWEKKFKLNSGK